MNTTMLLPIMLFVWVPVTIYLFFKLKPHQAVLASVIGGWLFLPMGGYNLPGLPTYSKNAAIAFGLILGGRLSGQRQKAGFSWKIYDLPMLLWCLSPLLSALTNELGWYDGLTGVYGQVIGWAVPYLAGRIYFRDAEAMRDLAIGLVIGGLIYVPLCLYEIKMSPRLSINFYGYFPHEWRQHYRYGGWRPIVFMQHGLMVALWMASTATMAFWLWRGKVVEKIKNIPIGLAVAALVITSILCKSGNGWFFLSLGCGSYLFAKKGGRLLPSLLLLSIPLYMVLRVTGKISGPDVEAWASHLFDAERVGSLAIRLKQEDLFIAKAMESPLFGWGGYSRGWPVDPETGKNLIRMVDSLWVIVISSKGFFGIITLFSAMLTGPWCIIKVRMEAAKSRELSPLIPVALSMVVIFFMFDSLVNGMVNPIFILISGALLAWHLAGKNTGASKAVLASNGLLRQKAK